MKKIDFTKRDFLWFVAGVAFLFFVEMIFNWQDVKKGFKEGYDKATKESIK